MALKRRRERFQRRRRSSRTLWVTNRFPPLEWEANAHGGEDNITAVVAEVSETRRKSVTSTSTGTFHAEEGIHTGQCKRVFNRRSQTNTFSCKLKLSRFPFKKHNGVVQGFRDSWHETEELSTWRIRTLSLRAYQSGRSVTVIASLLTTRLLPFLMSHVPANQLWLLNEQIHLQTQAAEVLTWLSRESRWRH